MACSTQELDLRKGSRTAWPCTCMAPAAGRCRSLELHFEPAAADLLSPTTSSQLLLLYFLKARVPRRMWSVRRGDPFTVYRTNH